MGFFSLNFLLILHLLLVSFPPLFLQASCDLVPFTSL